MNATRIVVPHGTGENAHQWIWNAWKEYRDQRDGSDSVWKVQWYDNSTEESRRGPNFYISDKYPKLIFEFALRFA